jgi:hypothetical protein
MGIKISQGKLGSAMRLTTHLHLMNKFEDALLFQSPIFLHILLLEWLTGLVGPGLLFSFLIYSQSVGLLGRVISP